jgi:hypothetical protein
VIITCESNRDTCYNYVRLAYATSKTLTFRGLSVTIMSLNLYLNCIFYDNIPNDATFYDQSVGLCMYYFDELNNCSFDHLNPILSRRYRYMLSNRKNNSMFINLNCWQFVNFDRLISTSDEFGLFVKFKYNLRIDIVRIKKNHCI